MQSLVWPNHTKLWNIAGKLDWKSNFHYSKTNKEYVLIKYKYNKAHMLWIYQSCQSVNMISSENLLLHNVIGMLVEPHYEHSIELIACSCLNKVDQPQWSSRTAIFFISIENKSLAMVGSYACVWLCLEMLTRGRLLQTFLLHQLMIKSLWPGRCGLGRGGKNITRTSVLTDRV